MECKNHPGVNAVGRCEGCAESFCSNCLVEIGGKQYCGACKTMAASPAAAVIPDEATIPCKEANDALIMAIIGIFCFGIILEPLALIKASKAKKMIAENPAMTGSGKATAATIIGVIGLILWLLGTISRIVALSQGTH